MIHLTRIPKTSPLWPRAKQTIEQQHYLHKFPDPRASIETYAIRIAGEPAGYLVFGRPEATRCRDWYGSVEDARTGRCHVTRWQVLNLARVWLSPQYQHGGAHCTPAIVPGYTDRRGRFRSTLASSSLRSAVNLIGADYLLHRPPCFLDEPYQIEWLLSYCDTRLHRGAIYAAAGFERYSINDRGIETWRIRLPPLTAHQNAAVQQAARINRRSIRHQAQRLQLALPGAITKNAVSA